MADDHFQNRSGNLNRGMPPAEQGTDPLAELARLIGQNDPFADFSRNQQTPQVQQQPLAPQHIPVLTEHTVTAGNYRAQEVPTPSQAPHNVGDYRDAAYRDLNQIPPGNEFYDEPDPRGRGRGMMTAMAVIALAVVGIVGAFGYRVIFSGPSSSAPPPMFRANPEPNKVPPPAANNESSQSKLTYDRVGDRSQNERVVSREEPPVDAKDLNRPITGRNQTPPSNSNQWAQAAAPNLPPASSTSVVPPASPMVMSEPKKVRTVPIRPDPNQDANMAASSLMPPSAAAPARSANAPNPPPVTSNQVRPPVAAAPTMQAPANAPLSLGDEVSPTLPRTTNQPAPRQAPPQRQTAVPLPPPQPLAAAPRQIAAAPPASVATAPGGSGFLVQVSSQRSEAEAQAALRIVQGKYPTVLGGQNATIRRADLGERGTFYRAMIGPFASRDQATQVCTNLKTAGGTCIVQGN